MFAVIELQGGLNSALKRGLVGNLGIRELQVAGVARRLNLNVVRAVRIEHQGAVLVLGGKVQGTVLADDLHSALALCAIRHAIHRDLRNVAQIVRKVVLARAAVSDQLQAGSVKCGNVLRRRQRERCAQGRVLAALVGGNDRVAARLRACRDLDNESVRPRRGVRHLDIAVPALDAVLRSEPFGQRRIHADEGGVVK